jgi:hypothetical protein
MKRSPLPGVDLGVYLQAIPLLVRNPSIIVVPLLMAVIGVLVGRVMQPYGGSPFSQMTSGLAGFILLLLQLFGLGAACIIADDAWRHGRASFDRGWSETQRRGGEILMSALGVAIVTSLGQFVAVLLGSLVSLILSVVIALFLIWAIPAAAIGGVPGGASIQISIDRVRGNPLSAAIATIVTIAVTFFGAPWLATIVIGWLLPYLAGSAPIIESLLFALFSAIAYGYVALILTKTYSDAAFTRR